MKHFHSVSNVFKHHKTLLYDKHFCLVIVCSMLVMFAMLCSQQKRVFICLDIVMWSWSSMLLLKVNVQYRTGVNIFKK